MHVIPYFGGRLIYLQVNGRGGFVIEPLHPVDGDRRWLWIAPSWLALPKPDGSTEHQFYVAAALANGFHIAGVDVGLSLGSPAGVYVYHRFYETIVRQWRLNPRARPVAQSNGALMHYNWAARHPDCVDRILGIYPATDLRSWPGLDKACDASFHGGAGYDMTPTELEKRLWEFNPIEQLEPLAAHGVRVLHLHGDKDNLVPLEPNSGELVHRYRALGGNIELEIIQGEGHTPGPKFYESQRALAFLLE